MAEQISIDYRHSLNFFDLQEFSGIEPFVQTAHKMLHDNTGLGNDFTGWVDWPITYEKDNEYSKIKKAADKIISQSEVFLVIGIGGSYLGAQAAIQMLTHSFYNQLPKTLRKTPEIIFLGTQLSSVYHKELFDILEGKEITVNVISKSGTTTEPAIAFRLIREYLEQRYGKEDAKERIYVTTDSKRGALKQMADDEGYETFVIPDEVGGRYSVLTAVGLLPIAVAGIDIDEIFIGAKDGYISYSMPDLEKNPSYQYAALRNILYRKGKTAELLVSYEPSLVFFAEWWKQLYGESEGKDHKGIFPTSARFTTDLHSLGQYIQEGLRNIFETVIYIKESPQTIVIREDDKNLDGLNYLSGKTLDYVNSRAMEATMLAHSDGGVPNILINVPKITPYYFGQLVYFFEKACGISGYLLGVNPFDQPGVEEYKRNMFALLGKPGFEKEKEILEQRLKR